MESIEQQKKIFDSFFLINYPTKVNLIPATAEQASQDMHSFEETMPYAFKMASQLSEIESRSLRPLRSMGEKLSELVTYLELQAQKIDLMMSYILLNEDQPEYKQQAVKFGGGGIIVPQADDCVLGSSVILKVFLEQEAAAVYCQAMSIASEPKDDLFHVSYVYTHIREQDQELLIRASLHLQTNQLRKHKKSD